MVPSRLRLRKPERRPRSPDRTCRQEISRDIATFRQGISGGRIRSGHSLRMIRLGSGLPGYHRSTFTHIAIETNNPPVTNNSDTMR